MSKQIISCYSYLKIRLFNHQIYSKTFTSNQSFLITHSSRSKSPLRPTFFNNSRFPSLRSFSASSTEKKGIEQHIIYEAPFAKACERLKKFSIVSLISTISVTPLIFILNNSLNLKAQALVALFVVSTSAVSTALIHWCISPYVAKITYNPSEDVINIPKRKSPEDGNDLRVKNSEDGKPKITPETFLTLETFTLLGTPNFTTLQVKSLEPSSRAFTTWKIRNDHEWNASAITSSGKKTKPKNQFYIHTELFNNSEMQDVSKIVA